MEAASGQRVAVDRVAHRAGYRHAVLQRTRVTAIILGIAAVIAILFMVFAYIKKIEADKQTDLAIERGEEAERQRNIALVERNKADSLRVEAVKSADKLAQANANL